MLKSKEYMLFIYLLALVLASITVSYLVFQAQYIFACIPVVIIFVSIRGVYRYFKRFNSNIILLLNALESGDYSFQFSTRRKSGKEAELNTLLNRIKELLAKARKDAIENESFLSVILESVTTGIIIVNERDVVQRANQSAVRLLGLPVFTHLNQLTSLDETYPTMFRNLSPNTRLQITISNEREEKQISLQAVNIRLKQGMVKVVTLNNIGNELEAKEMESWVKLIRVMTHEIMNSIAPITSLSEALLSSYRYQSCDPIAASVKADTIDALETIHTTAKGLITFVDSYRKFTGIPKPQCRTFDLKPLIDKIIHLESLVLDERGIAMHTEYPQQDVTLCADEIQITQVLVNLVKNAIEALASQLDGKIVVRVSITDDKVKIDVCNNGEPISPDVLPHIFVPFFTTKDTGSGIGLSVSRYIMRLHGGNLQYHTEKEFTVFSMLF